MKPLRFTTVRYFHESMQISTQDGNELRNISILSYKIRLFLEGDLWEVLFATRSIYLAYELECFKFLNLLLIFTNRGVLFSNLYCSCFNNSILYP